MRMGLGPYGPCGNQRVGSWPGRVPFASPHSFSTFLDAASGFQWVQLMGSTIRSIWRQEAGHFFSKPPPGRVSVGRGRVLTPLATALPASPKDSLS